MSLADNARIGFTGTRRGMTGSQKATLEALLSKRPKGEFHHGGASGADREAALIAEDCGHATVAHRPVGTTPEAHLRRNLEIVGMVSELFACPGGYTEERRSGTWATVRYARKARRPITLIFPDGSLSREP